MSFCMNGNLRPSAMLPPCPCMYMTQTVRFWMLTLPLVLSMSSIATWTYFLDMHSISSLGTLWRPYLGWEHYRWAFQGESMLGCMGSMCCMQFLCSRRICKGVYHCIISLAQHSVIMQKLPMCMSGLWGTGTHVFNSLQIVIWCITPAFCVLTNNKHFVTSWNTKKKEN
jgi:hypothetical protein